MLRIKILAICTLGFHLALFAQRANSRSKSELGLRAGGSYYIGDLNPSTHFQQMQFFAGAIYRYNVHSRLSFRTTFGYGNVEASDADATSAFQLNRNLSFQSDIYEFTAGVEFNYKPFQLGHKTHWISPYISAELGLFRMNPKTRYNNDLIEMQPLGTEGQGSSLSTKDHYSRVQLCIPIGIGVKVSLSKSICFSLEYGLRKTFTDYLDDVGAQRYADRTILAENNGPLVADLSNRSKDANPFGMRGNPNTKDWYFITTGTLSFRLGSPDRCFHH